MAAVRHFFFFLTVSFITLFSSFSLSQPQLDVVDALIKLKESFQNVDSLSSWDRKSTPPCNTKTPWVGVICSAGIVTTLNLAELRLSGQPDFTPLEVLDGLKAISVENNSLSGPVPSFNRLIHLKAIYASNNQFSGPIPPDYFDSLRSLKRLHLAGNKFSGELPASLGRLTNLRELLLENNEFTGPIPKLEEAANLSAFNVSNNKLEGEIPASLARFDAKYFEGNPGLCGGTLKKECPPKGDLLPSSEDTSQIKWLLLCIVVALLLITIFVKAKRKEERFSSLGKENLDDVVQVQIPSNNRRSFNQARKGTSESNHGGSRKGGASQHGRSVGDLVVVNEEKGYFGLQDLMKAAAEVLGNGGLGSAYKAMMANGVSVVVKRLREMNKLTRDAFDAEIRRLGRLRHKNILTPLGYHYRKEEKLLVSEYIPKGSLLYVLHGDRGISHAELNWPTRLKIIQGVARGMGFLHSEFASYELPHGNLKSSNILLSENYEPLLSDYAFYPLLNNTNVAQSMFAFKCPEAILYQQVSPKSDVYCLGIVILEIITGKYPSQYLNNQKGGTDVVQWVRSALSEKRAAELIDPEIATAKDSLGQMEKLLHIGAACTESEIDRRIDMTEAIRRVEEVQA